MKNVIGNKKLLRVIAIAIAMLLVFENVCYAAFDVINSNAAAMTADQTDTLPADQAYGQAEAAAAGENDPGTVVSSDENIGSEEEISDGDVMDDTDEEAVGAEAAISETGEETLEDDTDAATAGPSDPVICVYDDETGKCRVEVEYTAEMFGLERAPKAVVKKVTAELPDIIRAAEEKNEGMQAEQVFAYDISFYDQDGNEVEPVDGNTVKLRFKNMDIEETGDTEIKAYHVDDEMLLDEVELAADGEDFVLDAESFSIFTIMVLRVLGTGKGIRNVKLLDFRETGHFGETPQDVVIYSEDDTAAYAPSFTWEPVNYYIYKLEVDADFVKDDYTNDRIVEFELAPGLRFNYDTADDIKSIDSSFESVEWIRYQDEGYDTENGIKNQEIRDTYSDNEGEPYNPRGGKVTIKIKGTVSENNYAKTLDLLVLAEKPLINYLGCKDGLTIDDAIKIRVSQGTASLEKTEVDQDVTFMSDGKDYPHKSDFERGYFYGDHYGDQLKLPGEKTTMISSVFPTNYALTDNEYSEGVVMKKMALNFRADSSAVVFTVGEDSGFVLSTPKKRTEAGKDWWYYTAERNNIGLEYMAENKMPIDLQYTIPQAAAAGTVYNIEVLSTLEQWWDEDTAKEYSCSDYYEEKYRAFKVTVSGSGDFRIGFTGNTSVRNDTLHLQKGIAGSDEYHSMIAGTNLYKTGDVITPALYEVELPYNKMDIDAVGIPFNTNRDIEGYPAKLEFTDINDQKITIARTFEDPSEYMGIIDDLAVKQYGLDLQTSSYDTGIIVSREKLEDYYWEYYGEEIELGCLKSVKVWLPDFYQHRSLPRRSAYGVFYTAGAVYGHPLSSCAEGDTVRTVFKLSSTAAASQFEAIELVQEYTVDFFGKDGDDYDGADTVYKPSVKMSASGTSFLPGDTVTFDIESWGDNWNFGDEDKVWKPMLWISVPAGFDIVTSSAQFKYHTKSRVTGISSEKCNFADVTSQAKNVKPGWKVYELTFNEADVPFVGGLDKDWYCRYLSGSFSLKVLSTATNLEFAVSDYFFTGSELRNADAASIYSSDYTYEYEAGVHETVGNGFGLSNAEYIGCIRCDADILVKSSPSVVIGAELKKQKFDNWTTFDENTDGLTLGNNENFNTRISIRNQTSRSCENIVVYVPVPKENWIDILGTDRIGEFFTECSWDMYLTSCLYDQDAGNAKFTVGYAQIQKKSEIDADGSVHPLGGWSDTFSADTNFIKIELKDGERISNSDPVTYIPFEFSITNDKTKVDTSDKWKYAYSYEAGYQGTAVHSVKDSFGCILQNGKISGSIYLDKNYNGKKDELEVTAVSGVTFTVSDGKNKYDAAVFDNGNYEITGLPGSKRITITVSNPKNPDPAKDESKRFTKKTDSTETVIGSDVTPNAAGNAATKTIASLAALGGEAKVNIGFIEPLNHSVVSDPEGWATVSPEYIRSYPGQKISDATKTLSPQLPKVTTAATETHTGWKVYGQGYTDEELLDAAFDDEQTIYAVIQKAVKVTVTPKDNIEYDGKPVVASNEEPADIIYSYEGTGKASSKYYIDASGKEPTTAENSGAAAEGRPPKWPGTYYIQVSVKESEPYSAASSDFVRFEIKKKSLTKPSADQTSFVYDGEAKELQVTGFDESTMTMKSGSTTSATNAGRYSVTYVLKDNTKYQWSDGSTADVVISWSITKAKVTKPSADKTSFVYDGEVKELQVSGFDGSAMTKKAGTTSETNAGSYSVTYALKDKSKETLI